MSTESIGEKLRKIREENQLPLRKVAAILDMDVAILSKMERGERKMTKDIVLQLSKLYKYNEQELLVLFLSDKIMYEIRDEEHGMEALRIAEERIKYETKPKKKK